MSEEPGFTPDSPLTRRPKRNYLFLVVTVGLITATVATALIYRFVGDTMAGIFLLAWVLPLLVVCHRFWFEMRRRDGTGNWFDDLWRG